MGCVIDHLQADHRVRVLRDFKDARGTRHSSGETGIIRRMDLDWGRREILIEWERDEAMECLTFPLAAQDGPRNGYMREYFELGEQIPHPDDTLAARHRRRIPPVPALVEEPVTDPSRYEDAVTRLWALAARRRFDEAEAQLQVLLTGPDPYGGVLEHLAGDMVRIAAAHVLDAEATVYAWTRTRAVHLWYAWGSQATSGGEGTLRATSIRAAEQRLAECDALRIHDDGIKAETCNKRR